MMRKWPALEIWTDEISDAADLVSATLDDHAPAAIEDLVAQPMPPGGLWDPTFPPPPDPPPAPLHWRVFFDDRVTRDAALLALRQFRELHIRELDVDDEDWAARSQQSLTAIRAGRFIVAPPWDRPATVDADTTVIVVEPSRGFGTGHHASTRLCLRILSDLDMTGVRVLDLGTGSGVLAFAAALRHARDVVAIDVDPDAIESARESAALNPLPPAIAWHIDDFRAPATPAAHAALAQPFDVVLANLTGGMLRMAADRIRGLVAPGGTLVMSGFDQSEREAVRAAFSSMSDVCERAEDSWIGLALRR